MLMKYKYKGSQFFIGKGFSFSWEVRQVLSFQSTIWQFHWITLSWEVICTIWCSNHNCSFLSLSYLPSLCFCPILSLSDPLTSFVSWANTTAGCIYIDPGRYVMASYPLLDNVTESLVMPYRSPTAHAGTMSSNSPGLVPHKSSRS